MKTLALALVVASALNVAWAASPAKTVTPEAACKSAGNFWAYGKCFRRPERTVEQRLADLEFRVQELEQRNK